MKRRLCDFTRAEIKKIAESYANTKVDFNVASSFCDKFSIANSTVFYQLLKKAIVESIVSMETAKQMEKKAAQNAERYGGKSARIRTTKSYYQAFELRKTFSFDREFMRQYTKEYANSSKDVTLNEFAKRNCMTIELLERTIFGAIVDFAVDDTVVELLKNKWITLRICREPDKLFEQLLKLRKINSKIRKYLRQGRRTFARAMQVKSESYSNEEHMAFKRNEQKIFAQVTMLEYGIIDEMQDYAESLGLCMSSYTSDEGTTDMEFVGEESEFEDDVFDDSGDSDEQMTIYDLF